MSKYVVVLGGGESGTGAAILAKVKGLDVFLSDAGTIPAHYKALLNQYQIAWEENGHTPERILTANEVIKSPGIPNKATLVQQLKALGTPIISEIEFAGRYNTAKTVCITGSNGKTTTTMLTYQMLKDAGLNVGLAGNVGKSFAYQVATQNYDYYVIELSSFQLDNMYEFKADISVLLNITPDHLDRYEYKFQNYVDAKMRITQNQTEDDVFIYWNDDATIQKELEKIAIKAQKKPFSISTKPQSGAFVDMDQLWVDTINGTLAMEISELGIRGQHNLYNSMAAALSAASINIQKESIRNSLRTFDGVEHRLESAGKVRGVEYINDSKATNVDSAWYALECQTKPVVWICGGTDKGNDYSVLEDLVKSKVKAIVCLGVDNSKIHTAFEDIVGSEMIKDTASAEDAVAAAAEFAQAGDVVLLSPCCASFDLFKSYEDRGTQFKNAVRHL